MIDPTDQLDVKIKDTIELWKLRRQILLTRETVDNLVEDILRVITDEVKDVD